MTSYGTNLTPLRVYCGDWTKKQRTSETFGLNHHPRAALHRNAAIFELVGAFDDIMLL